MIYLLNLVGPTSVTFTLRLRTRNSAKRNNECASVCITRSGLGESLISGANLRKPPTKGKRGSVQLRKEKETVLACRSTQVRTQPGTTPKHLTVLMNGDGLLCFTMMYAG